MIVEYSPEFGLCLMDPFDFRRFKLVLKGELAVGSPASKRITLVGNDDALVPIDLIPTLPGRPDTTAWELDYATMIASAQKHGWIDVETNAIRAHIERQF